MGDSPTPAATSATPASDELAGLGERYFQTQHTYDPFNATLLGLNEFDHLVGDPGRDATESAADTFAEIADELSALDPTSLSDRDQVDYSVLAVLLRGAEGDARHSLWATNASAKSYVSQLYYYPANACIYCHFRPGKGGRGYPWKANNLLSPHPDSTINQPQSD